MSDDANPAGNRPSMAALLTGELDADAIDALLDSVEVDPDASRELELVCDVHAAVQAEGESFEKDLRTPTRVRIAVGVAAAAAAWLFWSGLRTDPMPTRERRDVLEAVLETSPPTYFEHDLRAPDAPLAERFRDAMRPYGEGRWAAARAELDRFLVRTPDHGPARFYKAAAAEALGQEEVAAREYRECADTAPESVAEHALWRLARLELRRDEPEAAGGILDELIERDGTYAALASALLARLTE